MNAQIAQKMKIKGSLKQFIRKKFFFFEGKNNIISTNLIYSNDCFYIF